MDIKITTEGGTTILESPYHPDLPPAARKLGGRFAGGVWRFDGRDEQRVRDLAREVYGTDGTPGKVVTIRIPMDAFEDMLSSQRGGEQVFAFGRKVVERRHRDRPVDLGDGVIVISGGFPAGGGSMKNPRLVADRGTVLEIRDVPAGHRDLAEYADYIQVVDDQVPAVEELLAERERLLKRLEEIEALLPEPEGAEMGTREAAAALGVSVRTVQRWAQQGKVQARKDERGRWVITITLGH